MVITSNNEKELPDAFLRRCVFHFIEFPDPALMRDIVRVHHPDVEDRVLDQALEAFYDAARGRRPAQAAQHQRAHRLDLRAAQGGHRPVRVGAGLPFLGTLLKKEQDVDWCAAWPPSAGARSRSRCSSTSSSSCGARKLPVTTHEWLALMEALARGLHG